MKHNLMRRKDIRFNDKCINFWRAHEYEYEGKKWLALTVKAIDNWFVKVSDLKYKMRGDKYSQLGRYGLLNEYS